MVIKKLLVFFILASFPLLGSDGYSSSEESGDESSSSKEISAQEAIRQVSKRFLKKNKAEDEDGFVIGTLHAATFLLSLGTGLNLQAELFILFNDNLEWTQESLALKKIGPTDETISSHLEKSTVKIINGPNFYNYIKRFYKRQKSDNSLGPLELREMIKKLILEDAITTLYSPKKEDKEKSNSADKK